MFLRDFGSLIRQLNLWTRDRWMGGVSIMVNLYFVLRWCGWVLVSYCISWHNLQPRFLFFSFASNQSGKSDFSASAMFRVQCTSLELLCVS
jgi:hypothetical protein